MKLMAHHVNLLSIWSSSSAMASILRSRPKALRQSTMCYVVPSSASVMTSTIPHCVRYVRSPSWSVFRPSIRPAWQIGERHWSISSLYTYILCMIMSSALTDCCRYHVRSIWRRISVRLLHWPRNQATMCAAAFHPCSSLSKQNIYIHFDYLFNLS